MGHIRSVEHRILRAQYSCRLNQTPALTTRDANVLEREPPIKATGMTTVATIDATIGRTPDGNITNYTS